MRSQLLLCKFEFCKDCKDPSPPGCPLKVAPSFPISHIQVPGQSATGRIHPYSQSHRLTVLTVSPRLLIVKRRTLCSLLCTGDQIWGEVLHYLRLLSDRINAMAYYIQGNLQSCPATSQSWLHLFRSHVLLTEHPCSPDERYLALTPNRPWLSVIK